MDNLGCVQHALLGLLRLLGSHTRENHGQLLWQIITEYGIQQKLGYFCLDTAFNNLSTIQYITEQHRSQIPEGTELKITQGFVRCYGDILNLVVKVFSLRKEI